LEEEEEEEEAQRKSAIRANPNRLTHITTSLADPCFPEGLTIFS